MSLIITSLLVILIITMLAAVPLHFSVKLLHGKTNFFKTIIINVMSGILVNVCGMIIPLFGLVIGLIITVFLFKYAFKVSFLKAILILLINTIISILLGLIGILLGIGAIAAIIGI
ncbi:hypothetical protein K9M74_01530 [Candidatus Woesearchaeota archaeon]|nr:hypothetical protein [Candidatus Woesearchaeota archaeon]